MLHYIVTLNKNENLCLEKQFPPLVSRLWLKESNTKRLKAGWIETTFFISLPSASQQKAKGFKTSI